MIFAVTDPQPVRRGLPRDSAALSAIAESVEAGETTAASYMLLASGHAGNVPSSVGARKSREAQRHVAQRVQALPPSPRALQRGPHRFCDVDAGRGFPLPFG